MISGAMATAATAAVAVLLCLVSNSRAQEALTAIQLCEAKVTFLADLTPSANAGAVKVSLFIRPHTLVPH